eukprot:TRINITY_DN20657_c0_g1_i1.p1 TRINITY_DN20657_c0_g1~~TRINITY_DN20657_c0_g1_i1.p1  ORF type:complete len:636 (+),score=145.27 TRINITY_DN20657_c0_g1_i1:118-1908(+)
MERKMKQKNQHQQDTDDFIPLDGNQTKKTVTFSTTIDGEDDDIYSKTPIDTTGMSLNEISELQEQQEPDFDFCQLQSAGIAAESLASSCADPFFVQIPDFDTQIQLLVSQSTRISQKLDAQKQRASQLSQHLSQKTYSIEDFKQKANKATDYYHFLQDQEGFFDGLGDFFENSKPTVDQAVALNIELLSNSYGDCLQKRKKKRSEEDQKVYEIISSEAGTPINKTNVTVDDNMEEQPVGYDCEQIMKQYHEIETLFSDNNASIEFVHAQLKFWEETHPESYKSIAQPSLPLCYEYCVRSELILLDPLASATVTVGNSFRFGRVSDMSWVSKIRKLHNEKDSSSLIEILTTDVVIPFVCSSIESCFDITSSRQTGILITFVKDVLSLTNRSQLPRAFISALDSAAKNTAAAYSPPKFLSSFAFTAEDFSALGGVSQSDKFSKVSALKIVINRIELMTKCVSNLIQFGDLLSADAASEITVGFWIGKSGYLSLLSSIYPSTSLSSVTGCVSALNNLLILLPKTWYSVDSCPDHKQAASISERMTPVRDLLRTICRDYKALRSSSKSNRESYTATERSLNSLCNTLGDGKAVKEIMSSL